MKEPPGDAVLEARIAVRAYAPRVRDKPEPRLYDASRLVLVFDTETRTDHAQALLAQSRIGTAAVRRGVPRLAASIKAARPDIVIACLVSIGDLVAHGLDRSGVAAELVILPFPSWYREEFVQGLATSVRRIRIRARREARASA